MRVLMLSLDRNILENGSLVEKRLVALAGRHGTETEGIEMAVLVPGERDEKRRLSEHLTVHSVGGAKVIQFFKMWKLAKSLILNLSSLTHGGNATYNLITVQDAYFVGLIGFLLARKFNTPFEIQVHGLERCYGMRKMLAEFLLRRADKIRVVSNRLKEFLAKSYKLKANSFYILPVYTQMGEKEETRERGRKRKGLPYPFTFLTVGRLVPVKNVAMQIRALSWLVAEMPHVRLVIVGNGPERLNLQLLTANLKLENHVVFKGEQTDTDQFYREADAFLLTSDSEGYGVAITEAAAYKLPIIMTNVGLAGEFIRHNENGIVIPVGDEAQLFGAMREVLQSPELRARLGAAAFRAFKSLPSREEQIEKQVEEWSGLQ